MHDLSELLCRGPLLDLEVKLVSANGIYLVGADNRGHLELDWNVEGAARRSSCATAYHEVQRIIICPNNKHRSRTNDPSAHGEFS